MKDEPSELDCVLEMGLEVEEAVDPVLEDEDSVLCCAPTFNATKQCSHILDFHIADGGKRVKQTRDYRRGIHIFRQRHVGVVMHWLLLLRAFGEALSWPIRSDDCVRQASGTEANLAAGGLFARHLEKRRKLTKVCSSPASEISERRVPKRVQLGTADL